MASRSCSSLDDKRLVGRVLIDNLPVESLSPSDIHGWLEKYGRVIEIIMYQHSLLVQFETDIEAAGAVQCENKCIVFGSKVALKHVEDSDLRVLEKSGTPLNVFYDDASRPNNDPPDYDRSRYRGNPNHSSNHREAHFRSNTPPSKRTLSRSSLTRSRTPPSNISLDYDRSLNYGASNHSLNYRETRHRSSSPPIGHAHMGHPRVPSQTPPYTKRPPLVSSSSQRVNTSSYSNHTISSNVGSESSSKKAASHPRHIVDIVALYEDVIPYVDLIEQRVKKLMRSICDSSHTTHVTILLSIEDLNPCLASLTKNGVPFAIICTTTNWTHKSCTVRILHKSTQQEHRNMPVDDAMVLLHKEYLMYKPDSPRPITSGGSTSSSSKHDLPKPTSYLSHLLHILADARRSLTNSELDEVAEFVQTNKKLLYGDSTNKSTRNLENNTNDKDQGVSNLNFDSTSGYEPKLMPRTHSAADEPVSMGNTVSNNPNNFHPSANLSNSANMDQTHYSAFNSTILSASQPTLGLMNDDIEKSPPSFAKRFSDAKRRRQRRRNKLERMQSMGSFLRPQLPMNLPMNNPRPMNMMNNMFPDYSPPHHAITPMTNYGGDMDFVDYKNTGPRLDPMRPPFMGQAMYPNPNNSNNINNMHNSNTNLMNNNNNNHSHHPPLYPHNPQFAHPQQMFMNQQYY